MMIRHVSQEFSWALGSLRSCKDGARGGQGAQNFRRYSFRKFYACFHSTQYPVLGVHLAQTHDPDLAQAH